MFGHVTNVKYEHNFGFVKDIIEIQVYEQTNLMPGDKVEITPKYFKNSGGFYPCKNNETIKELNEKLKQKESTIEQFKKEVEYWQSQVLCKTKQKDQEKPIEKICWISNDQAIQKVALKINELIDKVNSLSKG